MRFLTQNAVFTQISYNFVKNCQKQLFLAFLGLGLVLGLLLGIGLVLGLGLWLGLCRAARSMRTETFFDTSVFFFFLIKRHKTREKRHPKTS